MKKRTTFILFVLMFFSLTACGSRESQTYDSNGPQPALSGISASEKAESEDGGNNTLAAKHTIGDIILADGSEVKAAELVTVDSSNLPVAVIAEIREDGTALGLGVHRSSGPLQWALDNTAGETTRFTDIVCTQNDTGNENAADAGFSGAADGSGSWNVICSMDKQGTEHAAKNYPAFHFVNTYAETYGLAGDYASGWYMPGIAEVCAVYRNRESINTSLKKIYELDDSAAMDGLGRNWYWSSSQSDANDDYAWFVHYFNGYVCDCPKNFTNLHVLAVRIF